VIRSCGKLTYGNAQAFIDDPAQGWDEGAFPPLFGHSGEEVKQDLLQLHRLAQVLRARRVANGAVRLDKTKLSFRLNEEQKPEDCYPYVQREANQLVEEFMLLANVAVAQRIFRSFPGCSLLRRHPKPLEHKLEAILELYRGMGYRMEGATSGQLAESIRSYANAVAEPDKVAVLQLMFTQASAG
jgi:exoribonuclease R